MSWAIWIELIAKYGLELAYKLWLKWQANGNPTQQEWDDLLAMTKQTARDRMVAQLTAAGIPLDSPEAKALLALV